MSSRRQEFVAQVQHDFTYKAGPLSNEQHDLLQKVDDLFDIARTQLSQDLIDTEVIDFRSEKSVKEGRSLLRKAHRRANAAIVNEWAGPSEDATFEILKHPEENVESTRQAMCHRVTIIFYNLMTNIALLIPLGRYAAICKTVLEDARGEYLDAVNAAFECRG